MTKEVYHIKNNIHIRKEIFENIPNDIRPGWAGLVLSYFDSYIKDIPDSIKELFNIIDDENRWNEAYGQFCKIRQFLIDHKDYKPQEYLHLAEIVAKVTYNAWEQKAPFEKNSGYYISSLALKATEGFVDKKLEEEVKSVLLLFNHNKKLRDNLQTSRDFLLYKKIDDILWFDWDPIGINDNAPRDEYQSYVSEIFSLKKSGANRGIIANQLLKIEIENMGLSGKSENCLKIAEKIIQIV